MMNSLGCKIFSKRDFYGRITLVWDLRLKMGLLKDSLVFDFGLRNGDTFTIYHLQVIMYYLQKKCQYITKDPLRTPL